MLASTTARARMRIAFAFAHVLVLQLLNLISFSVPPFPLYVAATDSTNCRVTYNGGTLNPLSGGGGTWLLSDNSLSEWGDLEVSGKCDRNFGDATTPLRVNNAVFTFSRHQYTS